jgi:methylmalonyl-CoA mutase N-terminal domain/subunit
MTLQKNKTAKQRWLDELYTPAVKKRAERKEKFTTLSEVPIDPLYTAEDIEGFDPATQLAAPGEFPYTRGIHPTMYRSRLWTMRQFAGSARPKTPTSGSTTCSRMG